VWYFFVFHFITIKYKVSTWATQQVPLVKQDSITLPGHLRLALVFSEVCVTQSLILLCSVLWPIRWLLIPIRLVIVISTLTRFMDSGYPCGMYAKHISNYLIERHYFLFLFNHLPWQNGTTTILLHNLEQKTCKYLCKQETTTIIIGEKNTFIVYSAKWN
jgi:hypothetical protein